MARVSSYGVGLGLGLGVDLGFEVQGHGEGRADRGQGQGLGLGLGLGMDCCFGASPGGMAKWTATAMSAAKSLLFHLNWPLLNWLQFSRLSD